MFYEDDYNYEELRRLIIDYYGSASPFHPQTLMYVEEARKASKSRILEMASEIGIDIENYKGPER